MVMRAELLHMRGKEVPRTPTGRLQKSSEVGSEAEQGGIFRVVPGSGISVT